MSAQGTSFEELKFRYLESTRGEGRVVLVSGGVASGKTELAYRFGQFVAESGALLLSAVGSAAERTVWLGVISQLLDSAQLPPDIGETVTGWGEEEAPAPGNGRGNVNERLLHRVCSALLKLARTRPLVIVVDDVHFADEASLEVLLRLQRRIGAARVLLILNQRESLGREQRALRVELARQPYFRQITLGSLSPAEVERLVEDTLGTSTVTPGFAEECHRLSGGNPLIVRALAEDFRAHSRRVRLCSGEPIVDERFARAVLTCLHRGEDELLLTARAAAVLGRSATPDTIARVLGAESVAVTAHLEGLRNDGLMDGPRFRHEKARFAVLGDIPGEECAELHLGAAEVLHDDHAPHVEIAAHLVAAGDASPCWAVPILESAAEHQLARDKVKDATECLELALQGRLSEERSAALTAALVRAQWRLNAAAVIRHLDALMAADAAGRLDAKDALLLIRTLAWFGRSADAVVVLERLNGTAARRLAPADHRLTMEWLNGWIPEIVAVAEPPPAPGEGADAGAAPARARFTPVPEGPESLDNAELVLQRCWIGDATPEAIIGAMHLLIHHGRIERASYWCGHLLDGADETRRAVLLDVSAGIALRRGDLTGAEGQARAALHALPAHGWGVALCSPLAKLVLANTAMGNFNEARRLLRHVVPESAKHSRFWLAMLHARGHHHMVTNRLHAAVNDFQSAGRHAVQWGLDHPAVVPWRSDLAQAYLAMGQRDPARELLREQMTLGGGDDPRVRGVALRVLAMTADAKERIGLLSKAADLFQDCGDRYELALTYTELSGARQSVGDVGQARMMARYALQLAKACGASVLHDRLLPSSKAVDGAGTAGLEVLSAAERKVATLASRGLSNREIGRKLYITESTVEQHLTRVYRKLSIKRRSELPVDLPMELTDTA
ncbi:ATP-binding protein [Actinomadura rugatobispora]|uniref:ATP-binding protein n=1 Tax=Actinomadura rugatobispora TaxID=1994 RepID=A0ABW1ABF1_9ACTN|nr:LuxR family transcriptional regulator [Actinomadura rugatobispora]